MKTNIDFISKQNIKIAADGARSKYADRFGTSLPFNAERLLESEYGMTIIPVPNLLRLGFECAFSRDGKTILVDKRNYDSRSASSRLCFTFAHELAHKVLHEKYLPVIDDIDSKNMDWAEKQAGMFAAEFLMPEHLVLGVVATEILDRIDSILGNEITIQACVNYKIEEIARYFGVSVQAMENRIKNIDLTGVLSGPYISDIDIEALKQLSSNAYGALGFTHGIARV